MINSDFVHLHVHSEYSLLDGLGSPQQYAEHAAEMGFQAIAVTDHGNIDSHLEWQNACKKAGVQPLLGCELNIVQDMGKKERGEARWHLTILVKDFEGWKALARMLTIANLDGFYSKPRIDRNVLLEHVNKGLVILTGCSRSFLEMPDGVELLIELSKNRRVNCYLEVMPHKFEKQVQINQLCLALSQKYDIHLVATNDCHYVLAEHTKAQEVLLAIQRRAKWKDPDRWKFGIDGLYLRSADEMISEFKSQGILNRSQYYQAISNSLSVAQECWGFELPKREVSLPATKYEVKDSKNVILGADDILDSLTRDKRTLMVKDKSWIPTYSERYNKEMDMIYKKGFARYFLIVYEIIEWCKTRQIMIGPGRGSVGGSLVAFLLGITQVDPLKYDLLFERFISEDRIDFPDIDLDFEDLKCDQVRRHIEEEYGQYNVAGISTFLGMKGRAVIRDVGRVFEISPWEIDNFAKSIWARGQHDEGVTEAAGKDTKEGQYFSKKYPEEFRLMCVLEGQIRGAGQHPAGLIISANDLRNGENCSLSRRSEELVCNWDLDSCEHNGLIKIDVLKLSTLTMLNEAKRLIDLKEEPGKWKYEDLSLGDPRIFQMLSAGDTAGVFQFSGYACTDLCKKMGVDSFDDMAVVTALARPGPAESGMTDLYVRRKKGERWNSLHPIYEAITKGTYGVIVYQEQMMRAMTDLAGLSNSDADRVRKVIGKKRKAEEFEPYREAFLKGCHEKKTLNEKQAEEFWAGLLEWANYGFVKAHAVEYAMIGYWTAWLKLYHPTEFFCAQLTYGLLSDKSDVIRVAETAGMAIVTPKVGISDARRWIAKENYLYMPFIEIKGIGESQADKCVLEFCKKTPERQGFFEVKARQEGKGKLWNLLQEVEAFDPNPSVGPENSKDYFQFSFAGATGEKGTIEIVRKQMVIDPSAKRCDACKLRSQSGQVVLSSIGMFNALVLGEAPGKEEDKKGIGYVGSASKILWEELAKYKIMRRMLHVGNCVKCWPSMSKTPDKEDIEECFKRWMLPEILSAECRLVLATGNVPLFALTGKNSGISGLNGQTEWVEKIKSWVIWVVHPSSVIRSPKENTDLFQNGIEAFAKLFHKNRKSLG